MQKKAVIGGTEVSAELQSAGPGESWEVSLNIWASGTRKVRNGSVTFDVPHQAHLGLVRRACSARRT